MNDTYTSPFNSRYASKEMLTLFSEKTRYVIWRRLWVALAEAEMETGLPVTREQINELKAHIDDIDFDRVREYEKQTRHDVMAHIHAYGELCPSAQGIIHLGATSCYVTDNSDMIIYRDAICMLEKKLATVIKNLTVFALKEKDTPTLAYTHLQTAQPTTAGKRATLWLQDFVTDLADLLYIKNGLMLLGNKGTVGTQASFLKLFDGDNEKVTLLEAKIAEKMGFERVYPVSGQTYTRKEDSRILNMLSGIAVSAYKFADDMRLLQGFGELREPFGKKQVGSSAMAYKRNPMRCERICSISRYAISMSENATMTAATQWLERTLDDSANRRLAVTEAFLAVDSVLCLLLDVTDGIEVCYKTVEKRLNEYMPFIATENILMEAVKRGGDRQVLHEKIREYSIEARENAHPEQLIDSIENDSAFCMTRDEITALLNPREFIGRAPEQTREFVENYALPAIKPYEGAFTQYKVEI